MDSYHLTCNKASSPANVKRTLNVLIVTAVDAERDAVLRGLSSSCGASPRDGDIIATDERHERQASVKDEIDGGTAVRFEVIAAGVGPAYAAAGTAKALARGNYDLVISTGIGGGFPGAAAIGSLVVADAIVAADLGAETAEGQLTLDELGFGTSRGLVSAEWSARIAAALQDAGLEAALAPILSVSLATGRAETAQLRGRLVPGAAAEGMEGYGVAVAAESFGVACAELRAISNAVGPRDREAWRIGDALRALEHAFGAIASAWRRLDKAAAESGGQGV
ncbi:futalosine hydrolase [Paenibacillus sp. PAMC21692]|uniref:futalosine hydrolase n=1 Tax=Paenibacillus sp. PAMC21692 TaxID=2762320 RepID=UPI00164EB60E|nr:futalosine hydrolase [Paenibacillus sp. PAMC21692]QNK57647.1 futalosine hydrolase [Paenibacillus sp. PAMC21692]